jgi:hypothetical protein
MQGRSEFGVRMSVFRHFDKELVTALSVQLGDGHHRF